MTDLGRPTLQDVREWRDALDSEWGGGSAVSLDQAMQDEEGLYFQRFPIETRSDADPVRTGSAPADADGAVDALVPDDVLVRVRAARNKDRYRKQADLQVRFGRALLADWRWGRDVFRLIATDMVIRRIGVARVLFDDTRWQPRPADWARWSEDEQEDWEVQYRSRNPIVLERRNPRHVRWRQQDDGTFIAVAESYWVTVAEARLSFGHFPDTRRILAKRDVNERVHVNDVWVGDYRCLLLNDEPLFPEGRGQSRGVVEHGYRQIPYIVMPFRELGFDEPAERYRGLLTNAAQLYPLESNVLGMQVAMLRENAWRTWIGWTADDRDLDMHPGTFTRIDRRKGEYVEIPQYPAVPAEVLQTAATIDSLLGRNGTTQGPRTAEGARSAQQIWAAESARTQKLGPARKGFQHGVERAFTLACEIVEDFLGEPLSLPVPGYDDEGEPYGIVEIGPKDINGYTRGWEVTFGRRIDPGLLEQAKAVSALSTNNWMPQSVSWELSGLVDVPADWEKKLYLQALNRLPFMMEVAGYEMLVGEYGDDDWRTELYKQRMQQEQQQSQAPPPGAPGMPSPGGLTPPSGQPRGPQGPGTGQFLNQQMGARRAMKPGGKQGGAGRRPPGAGGM